MEESKYFELCVRLAAEIDELHKNSRRYIKRTFSTMIVMPFIILLAIFVTDMSKITALFIWLLFMFAACGYLIFLEYTDRRLSSRIKMLVGSDDDMAELREYIRRYEEAQTAEGPAGTVTAAEEEKVSVPAGDKEAEGDIENEAGGEAEKEAEGDVGNESGTVAADTEGDGAAADTEETEGDAE
jgi:hypothetical protein